MSRWNHALCGPCWRLHTTAHGEPAREPVRLKDAAEETCCLCEGKTSSGIYVRVDPQAMACKGTGPAHGEG